MKKAVNVKVTVCVYHVTYTFRVNLHSDQCQGILCAKQTRYQASMDKCLSVCLRTKWLWVRRVSLQSLKCKSDLKFEKHEYSFYSIKSLLTHFSPVSHFYTP